MKFLKQLIIGFVASCVLAVCATAVEAQKNDNQQKPPPPPKERQDVRKPEKPPPPRDNGNKGNDGKHGGKP